MTDDRSVVITGASTGIGRACALWMDELGWRVFAGVRGRADADALRVAASERLTPILLDVTKPASIRRARTKVERLLGKAGLSGLVNNAGIAYGGPVEFLDLDGLRGAFEVNFFGAVAVTQAFLARAAPRRRSHRQYEFQQRPGGGAVSDPLHHQQVGPGGALGRAACRARSLEAACRRHRARRDRYAHLGQGQRNSGGSAPPTAAPSHGAIRHHCRRPRSRIEAPRHRLGERGACGRTRAHGSAAAHAICCRPGCLAHPACGPPARRRSRDSFFKLRLRRGR